MGSQVLYNFFYPSANIKLNHIITTLVKLLKQEMTLYIQYVTSLMILQQFRIDNIYYVWR